MHIHTHTQNGCLNGTERNCQRCRRGIQVVLTVNNSQVNSIISQLVHWQEKNPASHIGLPEAAPFNPCHLICRTFFWSSHDKLGKSLLNDCSNSSGEVAPGGLNYPNGIWENWKAGRKSTGELVNHVSDHVSGQISSRPHEETEPHRWWFSWGKSSPFMAARFRLMNYDNLPRCLWRLIDWSFRSKQHRAEGQSRERVFHWGDAYPFDTLGATLEISWWKDTVCTVWEIYNVLK